MSLISSVKTVLAVIAALKGYKTYIGAAGLLGLSLYQLTQGETSLASQTLMQALVAFGLRSAITSAAPTPTPTPSK